MDCEISSAEHSKAYLADYTIDLIIKPSEHGYSVSETARKRE